MRSHFFKPPKVGDGDADFFGHGPSMEIVVELRVDPISQTTVESRLMVRADETESDFTSAVAQSDWETAFTAPDGRQIMRILSPTTSTLVFTDTDHEADIVRMPLGDLVDHFEIVGDTNGDDAGVRTGVRAHFRPIDLELTPVVHSAETCSVGIPDLEFTPDIARPNDADFDGNGPAIETDIQLRRIGGNVEYRAYMHAVEWDSANARPNHDFTTFDGWSNWQIAFTADPTNPVTRIVSPMQSHRQYIDTDHAIDVLSGDDLVATYRFVGDQDGRDKPSVNVSFADLRVQLEHGCGGTVAPIRSHFLRPEKVGPGDADFDGQGPDVTVRAFLRVAEDRKSLETQVQMVATETGGDNTEANELSGWETAYVVPDGQLITPFATRSSIIEFRDTDHLVDVFGMPPSDLVAFYEIVGDTDGEDAGARTGVRVLFRPVPVELTPAPAVVSANVEARPSPPRFRLLRPRSADGGLRATASEQRCRRVASLPARTRVARTCSGG